MKILALDVGTKRIGVARADTSVRIAIPDRTINVDGQELAAIASLARLQNANVIVVGLPRNNEGEETAQSQYARQFAANLQATIPTAKICFQDESLTSVEAETRLNRRLNKTGRGYQKGDVDAEAAAVILQDFLENLTRTVSTSEAAQVAPAAAVTATAVAAAAGAKAAENGQKPPKTAKSAAETPKKGAKSAKNGPKAKNAQKSQKSGDGAAKAPKPRRKIGKFIALGILVVLIGAGVAGYCSYQAALQPMVAQDQCSAESKSADCEDVFVSIPSGSSTAEVASILYDKGLIRNTLVFQLQVRFASQGKTLKAGEYLLQKTQSVDELISTLDEGANDNIFSFTFQPGKTLKDFKAALKEVGYTDEQIETGLAATYDNPVLAGKPADATLEGYLYGETYEFYKTATVEDIINKMLSQLQTVVEENNLQSAFEAHGLTLYEGITLASIVQKEATADPEAQKTVAQIFYSRLALGMTLGSDVTAQYAADLVDPDRTTYTTNSAVLAIDSPYNTRTHTGLTPGPISNPGKSSLVAAANPASTSYLFFLTGDDGKMYYGTTESEHEQNIVSHCQELCNTKL